MNEKQAQELATEALIWVAQDDELAGGFLGMTGAAPNELSERAGDPEFLGFVLDYVMSDDRMAENFLISARQPADALLRARAALPGGAIPEWT